MCVSEPLSGSSSRQGHETANDGMSRDAPGGPTAVAGLLTRVAGSQPRRQAQPWRVTRDVACRARRLRPMTGQLPADPRPPATAPASSRPARASSSRRGPLMLAWLGMLLIVSVAGAGLILSLDHPPTEEGRPELTAKGHAIVAPRLAAIDTDIEQLAAAGDTIAAAGRDTLTSLRALDVDAANAALAAGDTSITELAMITERLAAQRAALLEGTRMTSLPASDRFRIGTIDAAMAAAGQLPGYWQAVVAAGSGPLDLLQSMQTHDATVLAATTSGRNGKWAEALAVLADAKRQLVPAHAVREVASKAGADVSTLDDLLVRVDAYDSALVDLYSALQDSGGQTNATTRAALDRVNAAQQSLPADQTAMVIVMSDLVGPTITPILLSIESARGALAAAIEAEPQPTGPQPTGPASTRTNGGPAASGAVSS